MRFCNHNCKNFGNHCAYRKDGQCTMKSYFKCTDRTEVQNERPQGEYETECNVLTSIEQIVRNSDGWEDSAIEAVHNAIQTAIKCMRGNDENES